MKRFLILFLIVAAFAAWGEGASEKVELTFLHAPSAKIPANFGYSGPLFGNTAWEALVSGFVKANPNVAVRHIDVDLSTGSAMSMDAMVASGQAPDVYYDAPMRTAKYMVPEYALALDNYATDWADYFPDTLGAAKRNGKIYAFPGTGWMVAMNTNQDLLAKLGYAIPPKWTTDDFLKLAKKARDAGLYVTTLHAANQSSDQWWMPWFAAFGARYYAPGDYSRNTLNSPQGVEALKFLKMLIDEGYVRKDAASAADDNALADFKDGKTVVQAMQTGHVGTVPFKYAFTEFPRKPGTAGVGVAAGTSMAIVKATKAEPRNKLAASLAWHSQNAEAQRYSVWLGPGAYPSRKSVTEKGLGTIFDEQIKAVAAANGTLDMGISMPKFTAIRGMMFPLLQQFYTGKISAEEVLKQYEANTSKELGAK